MKLTKFDNFVLLNFKQSVNDRFYISAPTEFWL